eukprot:scpid65998/ scgid35381/ WSC domain-containing protein 2
MPSDRLSNFMVGVLACLIILLPPIYHSWTSQCLWPAWDHARASVASGPAHQRLSPSRTSRMSDHSASESSSIWQAKTVQCWLDAKAAGCSDGFDVKHVHYANYEVLDGALIPELIDINATHKLHSKHSKLLRSRFIKRVQPCCTPALLQPNATTWHDAAKCLRPIALASTAAGGGVFVRRLLEQLSGVLTGSVYRTDSHLRREGFFAEGTHDSSVIAVATHAHNSTSSVFRRLTCSDVKRAIIVLSNPFVTIRADFSRCVKQTGKIGGGKVSSSTPRCRAATWDEFVADGAERWVRPLEKWLSCDVPKLVLFLEQVQSDHVLKYCKELAQFVGFQLPLKRVECVGKNVNQLRTEENEQLVPFQRYTTSHIALINEQLAALDRLYAGIKTRYSRDID